MQDLNLIAVKRSHFLNPSLELWILLRIMLIVEVVHLGKLHGGSNTPNRV